MFLNRTLLVAALALIALPGAAQTDYPSEARADHRAVRSGRRGRHAAAPARPAPRADVGPAGGGREPDRARPGTSAWSMGAKAAPGRLHAHLGAGRQPRDQPAPLLEALVRRPEGLHADHAGRVGAERARPESRGAGEQPEGADRVREGPARQAHLRLWRRRDAGAHRRRAPRVDGRHLHGARGVQGRGRFGARSARRADRHDLRADPRGEAAHRERQAARARRREPAALAGAAERADDRRSRRACRASRQCRGTRSSDPPACRRRSSRRSRPTPRR